MSIPAILRLQLWNWTRIHTLEECVALLGVHGVKASASEVSQFHALAMQAAAEAKAVGKQAEVDHLRQSLDRIPA